MNSYFYTRLTEKLKLAVTFTPYYPAPGNRATFSRVPMSMYDDFKSLFGNKYRLRYRGPRAHRIAQGRSHSLAQSTCLKVDATHFSAYEQ